MVSPVTYKSLATAPFATQLLTDSAMQCGGNSQPALKHNAVAFGTTATSPVGPVQPIESWYFQVKDLEEAKKLTLGQIRDHMMSANKGKAGQKNFGPFSINDVTGNAGELKKANLSSLTLFLDAINMYLRLRISAVKDKINGLLQPFSDIRELLGELKSASGSIQISDEALGGDLAGQVDGIKNEFRKQVGTVIQKADTTYRAVNERLQNLGGDLDAIVDEEVGKSTLAGDNKKK